MSQMCQLYAEQRKTNNSYVDVLQARTCSESIPWRNQMAILERWSTARARTDFTPKCITVTETIVNKMLSMIMIIISFVRFSTLPLTKLDRFVSCDTLFFLCPLSLLSNRRHLVELIKRSKYFKIFVSLSFLSESLI